MKRISLLLGFFCLTTLCAREPAHFGYFQVGGAAAQAFLNPHAAVGLGFGWRYIGAEGRGIDISCLGMTFVGKWSATVLQLPRVRYLHYVSSNVYLGAGGSLGGYLTWEHSRGGAFGGVSAEFAVGMDLYKGCCSKRFIECSLSQPTIGWGDHRRPSLIFTFGFGF